MLCSKLTVFHPKAYLELNLEQVQIFNALEFYQSYGSWSTWPCTRHWTRPKSLTKPHNFNQPLVTKALKRSHDHTPPHNEYAFHRAPPWPLQDPSLCKKRSTVPHAEIGTGPIRTILIRASWVPRKMGTWVLVALTVCFTYPVLYRVSAESRVGEWELWVIDNENSWSLRADARRRITLYYIKFKSARREPDLSILVLPLKRLRACEVLLLHPNHSLLISLC